MPESSPLDDSPGAVGALPRDDDEIVHEQTVRAPIPVAPDPDTVKTVMPVEPPAEQTVRVFVPSAVPGHSEDEEEIEEVDELEAEDDDAEDDDAKPEVEAIDVSALVLELESHSRPMQGDVPVPRSDQVTVPERAAKAPAGRRKKGRHDGPPTRGEPAPVSGEVSVSEPEPGGLFGAAAKPRREPRPDPRSVTPTDRRDDPPLVSGEVAVDTSHEQTPAVPARDVYVMPIAAPGTPSIMTASGVQPIMTASGVQPIMTASGSQPVMTASGSQPVMTASGPHSAMAMTASGATPMLTRTSSDAGYAVSDRRGRSETGPHPVMAARENTRDSLVLWALAGGLVVLAVGVVLMVISWSQ